MKNNASLVYGFLLVIGDFLALLGAFVIAYLIRVQLDPRPLAEQVPGITYLKILLALMPFYLLVFGLLGLYNKDVYERRFAEFSRILTGTIIGMFGIIAIDFASNQPIFPARLVPVYALVISFVLVVLVRSLIRFLRHLLFAYGIGINNVLLIGNTPATAELARFIGNTRDSGYRIIGIYGGPRSLADSYDAAHFTSLPGALSTLKHVHTVVQTELYSDATNGKIIDAARENHIAYKFIPANANLYTGNNQIELFHNFPVIAVHQTALTGWGRIAKRLFDIFFGVLGLIISLPVLLVVSIIIKLTDPQWPVFYKHRRVSRFGNPFYVYKLRSMYGKYSPGMGAGNKTETELFQEMGRSDLVEEWKAVQKVNTDPRIMPIGRFTRKTGIDELPQLWNVIKGDLSLIGPRAVTKAELERYKKASSIFLSVKPGITGLWQVSGRNQITYEERIALDLYYVQHWSFLLDMKILYRTLIVMLTGKGQ